MADNVNISDYEKIIFVNNINENDDNQKTILTDNKYNFAVFASDNTNIPEGWPNSWKNYNGQPAVKTIWYKGQRLNRFVGIDPNNSTFTINDYTFKLIFDYEKGLLGISDINKLEEIRIYAIMYTDERNIQRNYSLEDNSLSNLNYISAIDNKFILYLDFIAEIQDETNIQRITKNINVNCASNNSNIIQDTSVTDTEEILYENNKIIARKSYTFKIIKDTYISRNRSNDNKLYTVISTFDSSKTADVNFMLSLNPIDFTITNGTNLILSKSNTTNIKTYTDLSSPMFDIFDVVIEPNDGDPYTYPVSHEDRKLYLKIVSSNLNAASIRYNGIENNQKVYIPVEYINNFELKINNVESNSTEISEISVSLTYNNTENNNPDIILKKFNIITTNNQVQQIIGIIDTQSLQIRANTEVIWNSENPQIVINPTDGIITTYSLASNIENVVGSYTITSNKTNITLGETVLLTIKWNGNSQEYSSLITARKTNWLSWSGTVNIIKNAEQPNSVLLSTNNNVTLNNSGIATINYTPTESGSIVIKTMDTIHTNGSCILNISEPVVASNYYIYIGLDRPTAATDPESDLASNNIPLFEGYAAQGWHNIGQDISIYNASNPAYMGGAHTVILNEYFDDVLCYIAMPVGMGIYDGFGNQDRWNLDQENITIKGHQYNVYNVELEGEFIEYIY